MKGGQIRPFVGQASAARALAGQALGVVNMGNEALQTWTGDHAAQTNDKIGTWTSDVLQYKITIEEDIGVPYDSHYLPRVMRGSTQHSFAIVGLVFALLMAFYFVLQWCVCCYTKEVDDSRGAWLTSVSSNGEIGRTQVGAIRQPFVS